MASRRAVTVSISGKNYRIVSDSDAEWLQSVASRVDEAMAIVRDRTETVDSLDIAVLTALNLARELMLLREETANGRAAGPAESLLDDGSHRLRELIELAEAAARPQPTA